MKGWSLILKGIIITSLMASVLLFSVHGMAADGKRNVVKEKEDVVAPQKKDVIKKDVIIKEKEDVAPPRKNVVKKEEYEDPRAALRRIRRELARWKRGEERWRRLSLKRWTRAELERLRREAIESQPPDPEDKIITIRRGDTLWDLADKYFSNPWLWPRLWAYNGNLYIENPHEITPGRKLVIPSWEKVYGRPRPPDPIPVPVPPPPAPVPPVVAVEPPPVAVVPPIIDEDIVERERLRKEIHLLKRLKDEKEKRIEELRKEIIDLKAKDIEREREKRKLEGILEDTLLDREIYEKTVVSKKEMEIARLSREVEDLKRQIYFLENELAKKEAEIMEKEKIIIAQEATIGSHITQINRLSADLDEERKEMEQFFAFAGLIGAILVLSLSN